ncbi:MAG: class I adenylate-forming enzyme family protein [Gammaproteobacteria bacterium]
MAEQEQLSVRSMLHRTARYFANNDALVDDYNHYNYGQMLDQVQRSAALLHSLGVRKGDRVALMTLPSSIHVIALFGVIELGAIPVTLHAREKAGVLAKVLDRLMPRALIYHEKLAETANELRSLMPEITGFVCARSGQPDQLAVPDPCIPDDLGGYEMDFEPMPIMADETAAIVLTSGTTGIPKGVMHSNRGMVEGARGAVYPFDVGPFSCQVNLFTTSFMGWYNVALPYINVGGKLVFMEQWDPAAYLAKMAEVKATFCFLVPTMWRMLLRLPVEDYDLSSIQLAGFAGEVMDPATLRAIRERVCARVINAYGTTETGTSAGTVMFSEDLEREDKIQSIGKPMLNSEARVIVPGGDANEEVPPGEEGEIIIRGPSRAVQMWQDPALSRKVFRGDWWYSGDLGHVDDEGYLYIHGRVDDMIITGGINVMPAPIEEVLLAHSGVRECVVVGLPDPEWGQRVTAFVIASDETVDSEQLEKLVKESDLAGYQQPKEFRFLAELPRGSSGKVSRKKVKEQAIENQN